MKWLLIVLLFQLDENGQPGPATPAQQLFDNADDCMEAGALARSVVPAGVLSVATCVPQNAFKPKATVPLPEDELPEEN